MKYRILKPHNLSAEVLLPASKSISNRALALTLLSGGQTSLLTGVSDCDDTTVMLRALAQLTAERQAAAAPTVIDIGAAGTSMRFLTAVLAVTPGTHVITGTPRMQQRPIGTLVDALRQLGASISYERNEGYPPLRIEGRRLHGGSLTMAGGVSSQYVSALMMIAPMLENGLRLELTGEIISRPYIDMTMAMIKRFGARAEWADSNTIVVGQGAYTPQAFTIEADWSAASYWYEIVLLGEQEQETATLKGLFADSLQGDSAVADIFGRLTVQTLSLSRGFTEPKAMIIRRGSLPERLDWDFTKTPDLAQTVVVACAAKGVPFHFTGLQSLRIKETDRIAALQTELAKLGVRVEVEGDSIIRWDGPAAQPQGDVPYMQPLPDTSIATYDDHRMAMAFAPLAMMLPSIDIENPEVVSKSYPRYWDDLRAAGFEVKEEL